MNAAPGRSQPGAQRSPRGEGAPVRTWIFLRGLTREAAHWGAFPAVFQRALPEDRIVMVDLPGNGQRHQEQSPSTVAGMVAACRAERSRQGIQTPVHLLAMSLGAMVAAQWAHTAPAEVAACVLINTSVRPFSPLHHRLQPHNYGALLRLVMARSSPEAAERTVLRLTSRRDGPQDALITDWVQARTQRPVSPRNALRQLLAAARYRAPIHAPPAPLLLLTSTQDRLVDSRCSEALARAWHGTLETHPWAGHDLPLDDPDWVADRVRGWLAAKDQQGARSRR